MNLYRAELEVSTTVWRLGVGMMSEVHEGLERVTIDFPADDDDGARAHLPKLCAQRHHPEQTNEPPHIRQLLCIGRIVPLGQVY